MIKNPTERNYDSCRKDGEVVIFYRRSSSSELAYHISLNPKETELNIKDIEADQRFIMDLVICFDHFLYKINLQTKSDGIACQMSYQLSYLIAFTRYMNKPEYQNSAYSDEILKKLYETTNKAMLEPTITDTLRILIHTAVSTVVDACRNKDFARNLSPVDREAYVHGLIFGPTADSTMVVMIRLHRWIKQRMDGLLNLASQAIAWACSTFNMKRGRGPLTVREVLRHPDCMIPLGKANSWFLERYDTSSARVVGRTITTLCSDGVACKKQQSVYSARTDCLLFFFLTFLVFFAFFSVFIFKSTDGVTRHTAYIHLIQTPCLARMPCLQRPSHWRWDSLNPVAAWIPCDPSRNYQSTGENGWYGPWSLSNSGILQNNLWQAGVHGPLLAAPTSEIPVSASSHSWCDVLHEHETILRTTWSMVWGFCLYVLPLLLTLSIMRGKSSWYQNALPRLFAGILLGYLLLLSGEMWQSTAAAPTQKVLGFDMEIPFTFARVLLPSFLSLAYLSIEINNVLKGGGVFSPFTMSRALAIFFRGIFYSLLLGCLLSDLFGHTLMHGATDAFNVSGVFGRFYPWSILMLAPLALFVGIFTQILWDDKSITHPV